MLDEGRYFKGEKVVKQILDEMALLKMNVFQWHLTDDQGWRIEIKKYPRLTEIGAFRDSTQMEWYESHHYDGKPRKCRIVSYGQFWDYPFSCFRFATMLPSCRKKKKPISWK